MTPADLTSLAQSALAVSERAKEGPWLHDQTRANVIQHSPGLSYHTICEEPSGEIAQINADMAFIAHARTALPQLARAVIALLPFVRHKPNCIGNDPALDPSPCTCGLDRALGKLGETQ